MPTSVELGHKVTLPQFRAIMVKAGTDAKIVKKLADALAEAAKDPEYAAYLKEQYADPNSFVPAAKTKAYLDNELKAMKQLIASSGVTKETSAPARGREVAAQAWVPAQPRHAVSGSRPRARPAAAFPLGEMMQASAKSAPFVILFCVALFLFSLTLQFDFPHAPGRLGPDVWPQAILVLLMLTCAIGVVRNFLVRRARAKPHRPAAWSVGDEEVEVPSRYMPRGPGVCALPHLSRCARIPGLPGGDVPADGALHVDRAVAQSARACWRRARSARSSSSTSFRGIVYVSLPLGIGPFQEWTVWVAQLLNMR